MIRTLKTQIVNIDLNGNDTDKSDIIDTKSQFLSKIKSALKSTIFTNGEAKLKIRRNFSFVDFCNYFTKIWNKPKLNMMYRVHFVGEAGQDDGGLSREFYWGMRTLILWTFNCVWYSNILPLPFWLHFEFILIAHPI